MNFRLPPSLDYMTSPIRFTIRHMPEMLARVAPERVLELRDVCAGLTLQVTDSPAFECHYSPGPQIVTISRKVLEVHWCAAYAYWTLYQTHVGGREVTTPTEVDLTADRAVERAMSLLQWSLNGWFNGRDEAWPESLPRPLEEPEFASAEHVADNLALRAVAFLGHHELAHHYRRNEADSDSVSDERATDTAAARWMLEGVGPESQEFQNRALGIAVALSLLTGTGVHTGDFDGRTHPFHADRLVGTLEPLVLDPNHAAWAMAVAILSLHLSNSPIGVPQREYDSFAACARDYAQLLRLPTPGQSAGAGNANA